MSAFYCYNNLHYLTRPDSLETCVLPQVSCLSVSQAAGHYRPPSSSSADSSISLIYWARSSGVSTTTGLQEHPHVAVMLQQVRKECVIQGMKSGMLLQIIQSVA